MIPPAVGTADERPHAPGGHPQWSESASFWLHDEADGLAGSMRVGVRPNEGMVDAGLHFWLPDGGFIAARHVRPESANTERLEAGDARFELVEPLRRWRIFHDGPAHSLKSAREAGDRDAWHRSRVERLIVDLEFVAAHDAIGFAETGDGVPSPREGFEQPGRWTGSVWISGDEYRVNGFGIREKSWGLRDWQAPRMWRRFSIACADGTAASAVRIARDAGADLQRGWLLRGGTLSALSRVSVATTLEPDGLLPAESRLVLGGPGLDDLEVTGRIAAVAPMRSSRNRRETLICEGLARFEFAGATGHGIAEYLHQLDAAGAPVVAVD